MDDTTQIIVTVICSAMTSSGLWAFLQAVYNHKNKKDDKTDAQTRLLIGLAHDRIITLGRYYLQKGEMTADEYENFREYLYEPYAKSGGNGSAKRMMTEVDANVKIKP